MRGASTTWEGLGGVVPDRCCVYAQGCAGTNAYPSYAVLVRQRTRSVWMQRVGLRVGLCVSWKLGT